MLRLLLRICRVAACVVGIRYSYQMQDPAIAGGVCKSTEWKGGSIMILLLLILILVLLRRRRTRLKVEIDL